MSVLALSAIAVAHGTTDAATNMPNIGYAASGYNIFYANPHSTQAGVDLGFETYAGAPVFVQTYSGATTSDGRYNVPDGFTLRSDTGCHLTFTSTATAKTSEYKKSLETAVSADFSGYGASFSASTDYKHFRTSTTAEQKRSVSSVAECSVYSAANNRYAAPVLTDNFKAALAALPAEYGDGSAFFDLIDEFGTHLVKHVTMGARFGFNSYFTEEGWTSMESDGIDVTTAAEYEGVVKAGGKVDVKSQQDAQQAFDSNKTEYELITLGSAPARGDAIDWAQQAITEPMPIRYSLVSLCDVIADAQTKAGCQRALDQGEYCAKRVLGQRKDVTSCDAEADQACIWISDCGPAEECVNNFCKSPTETGHVVAINRYWHEDRSYNTFHPAPAWEGERSAGDGIFYAFAARVGDSVPINRYCNGDDSTFHPSAQWPGEHNCGDAIFYAYSQYRPGTVAINRYWNDEDSRSTFHPSPEWPNEHDSGDNIFFAYAAPASCSAHSGCSINAGDCCPTADGEWLQCCDLGTQRDNSTVSFVV